MSPFPVRYVRDWRQVTNDDALTSAYSAIARFPASPLDFGESPFAPTCKTRGVSEAQDAERLATWQSWVHPKRSRRAGTTPRTCGASAISSRSRPSAIVDEQPGRDDLVLTSLRPQPRH